MMNKECICGKVMPYKTDQDKAFFAMYHSNCTNDDSALDSILVY
jgi:hypothetical protein